MQILNKFTMQIDREQNLLQQMEEIIDNAQFIGKFSKTYKQDLEVVFKGELG